MRDLGPHLLPIDLKVTSVALNIYTSTSDNNMSSPSHLLRLPEELLVSILDDLDQHAVRNARLCCRKIDNLLLDAFSKQIPRHIRCCFVKPIQLQSLKALTTRRTVLANISTVTLASIDPNDFIDPRRGKLRLPD